MEQSNANLNTVDNMTDQTPLSWAVMNVHEEVVRILFEQNCINPNIADSRGRTPLSRLPRMGMGVVRILRERNDVNIDPIDQFRQTLASWATWNGRDRIAKLLQDRADFVLRYAAGLRPTHSRSPEPAGLSEYPSKKILKV